MSDTEVNRTTALQTLLVSNGKGDALRMSSQLFVVESSAHHFVFLIRADPPGQGGQYLTARSTNQRRHWISIEGCDPCRSQSYQRICSKILQI